MADDTAPAGTEPTGSDGFKPITSQEEFNAKLGDRITRAVRKATEGYADYDDLKAKAAKFDAAQQASKTEAEKTAERIAALEADLAGAKSGALRASIAAEFGVSTKKGPNGEPSDADLFLTATDEATLRTQAERLAQSATDRKKTGGRDPFAGRTPSTPATDPLRAFTREMFGGGD